MRSSVGAALKGRTGIYINMDIYQAREVADEGLYGVSDTSTSGALGVLLQVNTGDSSS